VCVYIYIYILIKKIKAQQKIGQIKMKAENVELKKKLMQNINNFLILSL